MKREIEEETKKPLETDISVMYPNARGIKSKINFLKKILMNNPFLNNSFV